MRIGKGWAPETMQDEVSPFAVRELRTLLAHLFISPKPKLRAGKFK